MAHLHPLHLGVDGVHRVFLSRRRVLLLPDGCRGTRRSPAEPPQLSPQFPTCLGGIEVPKRGQAPGRGGLCPTGQAAPVSAFSPAWAHRGPLEVVGVVRGVVYLSPSLQDGYRQIHWWCNNTLKIASRENGQKVQYPSTTYKGRLELFLNYTLKISHLQKNDSSVYQVYLDDKNGKEHIESILLKVYDLVPKPTVKAKVIRDEPELCKATLECSVGLEEVTYEWIPPSKLPLNGSGGSEQLVSFNPSIETYVCKVSNPVSSNYASLTYKHPCSWIGESSAAASHTSTSVLVALGHLLLLFLALA
ncbi:CD48 antigen-like [Alca torda]